jgi:hypothetical protein
MKAGVKLLEKGGRSGVGGMGMSQGKETPKVVVVGFSRSTESLHQGKINGGRARDSGGADATSFKQSRIQRRVVGSFVGAPSAINFGLSGLECPMSRWKVIYRRAAQAAAIGYTANVGRSGQGDTGRGSKDAASRLSN